MRDVLTLTRKQRKGSVRIVRSLTHRALVSASITRSFAGSPKAAAALRNATLMSGASRLPGYGRQARGLPAALLELRAQLNSDGEAAAYERGEGQP